MCISHIILLDTHIDNESDYQVMYQMSIDTKSIQTSLCFVSIILKSWFIGIILSSVCGYFCDTCTWSLDLPGSRTLVTNLKLETYLV